MMRLLCFLSFLTLGACAIRADQYWIEYEANDFPENVGWLRFTGGGGAQRAVQSGWFVLDSRQSLQIYDYYRRDLNGRLDPEPGETFVLQWRLHIEEVSGWRDPTIAVFSDDKWAVGFEFTDEAIWSGFEPGVGATFQPGVPHDFELRSGDMLSYELYIDDVLRIEGSFWSSLTASEVSWGDGIQGGSSLTRWDYVRFGVVPEPGTGILSLFLVVVAVRRLRIAPT